MIDATFEKENRSWKEKLSGITESAFRFNCNKTETASKEKNEFSSIEYHFVYLIISTLRKSQRIRESKNMDCNQVAIREHSCSGEH